MTELGRDYFHFEPTRHALIGERSGRVFQLAGRVRVRVARVDLEATKIDFTLDEAGDEPAVQSSRKPAYSAALTRSDRPRSSKRSR